MSSLYLDTLKVSQLSNVSDSVLRSSFKIQRKSLDPFVEGGHGTRAIFCLLFYSNPFCLLAAVSSVERRNPTSIIGIWVIWVNQGGSLLVTIPLLTCWPQRVISLCQETNAIFCENRLPPSGYFLKQSFLMTSSLKFLICHLKFT